jgi:hypothetical protein
MSDEMIKTRFTPMLVRTKPTDDVQSGPMRYDAPVAKGNGGAGRSKAAPKKQPSAAHLRACPFCRELFVDDETEVCPECGIAVRDLASLPASPEAQALEAEEKHGAAPTVPQAEPLAWKHMGRGRGILAACALAGMAVFFMPWAKQTVPETIVFTGFLMAKLRPFYWAIFTAWLVLFPAVLSRRTVLKMVGARLAVIALSAIPGVQAALVLAKQSTHLVRNGVPFELQWMPGIFATLALSAVATIVAFRFGGRLDDVETRKETSAGHVLH